MDIKIIGITFLTIFIAELGDKTQLAAFSFSAAASGSKWSIFAGSALALILASFLAVFFGHYISRYIPVYYLKILSAVIFLVIGSILLFSSFYERAEFKRFSYFIDQINNYSLSKCSGCVKFKKLVDNMQNSQAVKKKLKVGSLAYSDKTLCAGVCKVENLNKTYLKEIEKFS